METISISKFKATCLELLERVRQTGEPLLVTKRGKPIAEVIPPPMPETAGSWLGSMKNSGKIIGDIVSPASEESDWEVLGS